MTIVSSQLFGRLLCMSGSRRLPLGNPSHPKPVDDQWQMICPLSPNHPAQVLKNESPDCSHNMQRVEKMEPIKLYSEEATRCYYCGKTLGNQRCAGNTQQGPKWFCRQEPDSDPLESCFSHWRMRHAKKAS
jgi:hypothetical protein